MTTILPDTLRGYSNHVALTRDGKGKLFGLVMLDGPGESDVDAVVIRYDAETGEGEEIGRFRQADGGKPGYGGLTVYGDDIVVLLPQRNDDGKTTSINFHRIENVATSWSVLIDDPGAQHLIKLLTRRAEALEGRIAALEGVRERVREALGE